LPVWELQFQRLAAGTLPIATASVKHDPVYQKRRGVEQGPALDLPPALASRIQTMAKRICRTLEIDGYARVDFRLTPDGIPYYIEANPNPEIAEEEEFAQAALHEGTSYTDLLNRLLALGINRAGLDED
jgi:D-alanine-D-alanine ligase